MQIGVLGCGVVGLQSALQLQSQYRNAQITILADKFLKDTTSDVAAGIFLPDDGFFGPSHEITRNWLNDAFIYWNELRQSIDGGNKAGICELSGYSLSSKRSKFIPDPFRDGILPIYREASEDELFIYPGKVWKSGCFFTSVLIECGLYLPWAMEKFQQNGGKIIQERISCLKDLKGRFDIVVNCTGLGAKYLCNDRHLVPLRGQVVKVYAPWIKTAVFADNETYIIPGFEGVTLGGCRNYDNYDLEVSKYDSMAIWDRCSQIIPSLEKAPEIKTKVGLRPLRDPVRVETELIETNNGRLKVVHNYGHAGFGVMSSPGTAKYAVKLVNKLLSGQSKL